MRRKVRYGLCYGILLCLLVALVLLSAAIGSTKLPWRDVWQALLQRTGDEISLRIVWEIRLPRLLAALLLGGALAVSGFLLQTFFANPIAGPFVLGISSGAKLVVALTMIYSLGHGLAISSALLVIAAFLGSMLCTGLILLVAGKVQNMALLIVSGVMIGYVCSAVTDLVVTFADDANIVNLHNWSLGSFAGVSWGEVRTAAWLVCPALLLSVLLSKPMSAYMLGAAYAENLGVPLRRFRVCLLLLSSILSACVTAFAGPISFVGIAVPHLMRSLFGSSKPLVLISACFLGGSVFCLWCDLLSRSLFAPTELAIGTVTAMFGAPVVLWMLLTRKR